MGLDPSDISIDKYIDKKWIKKLLLITIFISILSILFNFIINPYGVFKGININGVNSLKNFNLSDSMSKFYSCRRMNPSVLMIGSSRMKSTDKKYIQEYTPGKVCNLGIAGSVVLEHYHIKKYFIENTKTDTIILGVDFSSYNPKANSLNSYALKAFDENRFQNFYLKDYIDSLLSSTTLKKSLLTLINNFNSYNDTNKNQNEIKVSPEYKNTKIITSLRNAKNNRELLNNDEFKDPKSIDASIDYFRKIVDLCKNNNIELKVYISPIYSKHTDLIYAKGLGFTYEKWKEELISISDLYDFSGYNSVTNNKDLFDDSSHISKSAGKLISARIFGNEKVFVPEDFGIFLDKKNIRNHIVRTKSLVKNIDLTNIN
jgi:hypothetical protein